jgi:hypothetical protein
VVAACGGNEAHAESDIRLNANVIDRMRFIWSPCSIAYRNGRMTREEKPGPPLAGWSLSWTLPRATGASRLTPVRGDGLLCGIRSVTAQLLGLSGNCQMPSEEHGEILHLGYRRCAPNPKPLRPCSRVLTLKYPTADCFVRPSCRMASRYTYQYLGASTARLPAYRIYRTISPRRVPTKLLYNQYEPRWRYGSSVGYINRSSFFRSLKPI